MYSITCGDRRIKLYKEGGSCAECYVEGIGWVVDDDASDAEVVNMLMAARKLCIKTAEKLCPNGTKMNPNPPA